MNLQSQLLAGSRQLGIELSDSQAKKMTDYLALLQKWNRSFNLTAISDPEKMLSYHLLDSLSIVAGISRTGRCLGLPSESDVLVAVCATGAASATPANPMPVAS